MLGNCTSERDYSREIGDEEEERGGERVGGGGRAEVRRKEHQVSAAISFAASAAPPSVRVRAGELQMFHDDVRLCMWRGPHGQFTVRLFAHTHPPAVGTDPEAREMSWTPASRATS